MMERRQLVKDPIVEKVQRLLTGRLNQLCREQRMTLKQLSIKSRVSLSTLRRIAKGKHCNVGVDIVIKISRAFEMPPCQFLDETLLKDYEKDSSPSGSE